MKRLFCWLLLASCPRLFGAAAGPYAVDWKAIEPEILDHFTELLKIDTSDPPGNETRAADAIRAVLEREGIPCRLFALDPARANLVARIRGNGSKRPLLLMGHTDVVGVDRSRWSVDPFAALRKGNVIYARGAVDDKHHVVAGMMVLILLHRMHVKLDRDVIFLAEAGEEGASKFGIDYMVREHWPEIDSQFALAEGGAPIEENGKVRYVLVATTEKVSRGMDLVAHGPSGHGSRPLLGNAIVHLAGAVERVGNWNTPLRLTETTREYFRRLAAVSPPADADRYRGILDPARAPAVDRYFREHDPDTYSILRTSVVPTILNGGMRYNVIPSQAEAHLDVRMLPDENVPRFLEEMRGVVNDPAVEIVGPGPQARPSAEPSRIDSDMFRALEAVGRRMYEAPTIPTMLTGATDNAQLRGRGVQAYGVGAITSAAEGPLGGAHVDNEHIAVSALDQMVEYIWNATLEVAAAR